MQYFINISREEYDSLRNHLFTLDGAEAVAIALCGSCTSKNSQGLVVHKIIPIPYDDCTVREVNRVTWSTKKLIPIIQEANQKGLSIVKIHCHPQGGEFFSETDDISDKAIFSSIHDLVEDQIHGSLIMLPNGKLFGRFIDDALNFIPIERIRVVGDTIKIWDRIDEKVELGDFTKRNQQAFGEGTTQLLKKLKVAVVGCSGTGSPVIEQLVRLGVGELILVDDDDVKSENLNRIIHATIEDAENERKKVDVIKNRVHAIGLGTIVKTYPNNLFDDVKIIKEIASCDFIFGCVDSLEGRDVLNRIASLYIVPYIDLGVKLESDGEDGINKIITAIHYLRPGFSLINRKVISIERLRAESLKYTDPKQYELERKEKYVVDVEIESPAVIHVNTLTAALAVNEFIARLHHFRDNDRNLEITKFELVNTIFMTQEDAEKDIVLSKYIGRGDMIPLLNMPWFS